MQSPKSFWLLLVLAMTCSVEAAQEALTDPSRADPHPSILTFATGSNTISGRGLSDGTALSVMLKLEYELEQDIRLGVGSISTVNFMSWLAAEGVYDLDEVIVTVGYPLTLGQFSLVPEIGYSRYTVFHTDDYSIFLSGSTRKVDDSDLFLGLRGEVHVTQRLWISLGLSNMDTDFGKVRSQYLGIHWSF